MDRQHERLVADLFTLELAFDAAANVVVDSINSRPPHGLPASPRDDDFADETLAERNLLTFSVQGALGLLQSARGNARALSLIYNQSAPAMTDPAPFAMLRSIWEMSHTCVWLLDGRVDSPARIGRMKGWLSKGLDDQMKSPRRFDEDTCGAIQASLDECPEPAVRPLDYVTLSKQLVSNGEDIYRTLSSLVHGQAWAVIPAFDVQPQGEGHYIRWRAYPLTLHIEMALPVIEVLALAVSTVHEYFTGVAGGYRDVFAELTQSMMLQSRLEEDGHASS